MSNDKSITKVESKPEQDIAPITQIANFMDRPEVQSRFTKMLGERGASKYIASVMLAVAEEPKLQECSHNSIYINALRAATLKLSVEKAMGQAYLVPFKGEATLIVGYKGLEELALRTGAYDSLHVGPIFEDEEVTEDRYTGLHAITSKTHPGFKRTIDSEDAKKKRRIIGWLGAFKLKNGFRKTFYMTVEEIHAHAQKYSPSYAYNTSLWNTDNKKNEVEKMERKTVLRLMLKRWGPMDANVASVLEEAEGENGNEEVVNGKLIDSESEITKRTKEQNLADLGFGETKYRYLDAPVVQRVADFIQCSLDDATKTLKHAYQRKMIGEQVTLTQIDEFCKTAINA